MVFKMDSKSLIEILEYERGKMDEIVSKIYDQDHEAQITADMNIKELLGHISWYEQKINHAIQRNDPNPTLYDNLSIDEKNRQIAQSFSNLTFDEVKQRSDKIFKELKLLLNHASEDQLNDKSILKNESDTRLPWQVLIDNSFIHYEEHMTNMKNWLKKNKN